MSEAPQTLLMHLIELRRRLMWAAGAWLVCVAGCYVLAADIYAFLVEPLANSMADDSSRRLIFTSLTETFFTYMKLAFWAGFFVAFPFIAAQFYAFVAPGLYRHERRVLLPYLVLSPLLFFAGVALCYYGVMPLAWAFFLGFEMPSATAHGLPIQLEAKVSDYLSLVMQLLFAFGMSFQMPIVLTLLARIGLVRAEFLAAKRRYAIVALATAAAILTPPDVLSQIGLFIPLYCLYEISIVGCRFMQPKEEPDHA